MSGPEQPQVKLLSSWGDDRAVATAAWVSTSIDESTRTDEQVADLVRRLAEQGHGVPFESVYFRWWIRCPRYVETQIAKHRISSMNGASGRYRKVAPGYQGLDSATRALLSNIEGAEEAYVKHCEESYLDYNDKMALAKERWGIGSLEYKRFKEFYRGILPQAQMTELHLTMNLRSFANFYKQRAAPDAQREIQVITHLMMQSCKDVARKAIYWAIEEQI